MIPFKILNIMETMFDYQFESLLRNWLLSYVQF